MSRFVDAARLHKEQLVLAAELSRETTPLIDERFLSMAQRATDKPGAFFSCIDSELLKGETRPESVNHHLTFLPPNPATTLEIDQQLEKVDIMLSPQASVLTKIIGDYADNQNIFERLKKRSDKSGEKFVFVSNHLKLPDQGFTMGLLQKAAREQGIDRLEHNLTVVVGRLIGYFMLDGVDAKGGVVSENVIDDILRKAGSVLKTFPRSGSESMEEGEDKNEDEEALTLFRKICNQRTKHVFQELIESREGRIMCMAPSGAEDKLVGDTVQMSRFGEGTADLMVAASRAGATIVPMFVDFDLGANLLVPLDPIGPGGLNSREDCDEIGDLIAREGTYARGAALAKNPEVERYKHTITYKNT